MSCAIKRPQPFVRHLSLQCRLQPLDDRDEIEVQQIHGQVNRTASPSIGLNVIPLRPGGQQLDYHPTEGDMHPHRGFVLDRLKRRVRLPLQPQRIEHDQHRHLPQVLDPDIIKSF